MLLLRLRYVLLACVLVILFAACGGITGDPSVISTAVSATQTANTSILNSTPTGTTTLGSMPTSVPGKGTIVGHMKPGVKGWQFWNASETDSLESGGFKDVITISSVADPFDTSDTSNVLVVSVKHFGSTTYGDLSMHVEPGIYFYESIQNNVNTAIPPEFNGRGEPYNMKNQKVTCETAIPSQVAGSIDFELELKDVDYHNDQQNHAALSNQWFSTTLNVAKGTLSNGFAPDSVKGLLFYIRALDSALNYSGPILYVRSCDLSIIN